MVPSPALVASLAMYRMSCTPLIAVSSCMMVLFVSTSALAPGYAMKMFTVVGAISGNCAVGSCFMAKPPTKRISTEMTMASTGRWMKFLNMARVC